MPRTSTLDPDPQLEIPSEQPTQDLCWVTQETLLEPLGWSAEVCRWVWGKEHWSRSPTSHYFLCHHEQVTLLLWAMVSFRDT